MPRTKSGKKLYTKWKKRGHFQDIHRYERAHGQDTKGAVRKNHNRLPSSRTAEISAVRLRTVR
jgi:hypothetical protein